MGFSKIIQIACCGHNHTLTTEPNLTLFALCDNGSLWVLNSADWYWSEVPLPKIPDPITPPPETPQ